MDQHKQNQSIIDELHEVGGTFERVFISNATNTTANQYSFKDILKVYNDKEIDILKIDIEGGEFESMDQILSVPICQILIEIHGGTVEKTLNIIQQIAKKDFYLFAHEVNGHVLQVGEYSFIHKSCFNHFGVIVYGRYLVDDE
uniref:Methyltransferase domain-containing protein n=1 Tax=Acrobeloides nanus TaxID=290746 RepID=A0A914DS24_9BILA